MRYLAIYCFLLSFISCDFFKPKQVKSSTDKIVASVNNENLYRKDLETILPENFEKQDSIVLVNSFINSWAIKRLLLDKAKNNSTQENLIQIDRLVNDYKESLLINTYKEQLVKQQLDTVVSEEELEAFYHQNKENFKLNEELVKIKYLHVDNTILEKDEIIKLFKSTIITDLELLEKKELSFKFHQFNDSIWSQLDNVLLKLPISKQKLLKKTKFLQKQDSIGLYLVAIKDVLPRNSIAPISYITSTIKQMILHKRKIELIRGIEKIIVKDATQNNNFKTY